LTEKYITLNKKDEFIYKMDLVPEIINDLFIIPLQYHEFRFILGFLALKITDLDNKTIDKANLLTPSLWNVLRDTFEIKFE